MADIDRHELHTLVDHIPEPQMAAMAADPGVQAECAIIAKEFSVADLDGLRHD